LVCCYIAFKYFISYFYSFNLRQSYLDLSKQLSNYDVYVIDDNVVASGCAYSFSDIHLVVQAVTVELYRLTNRILSKRILVGGWSYGGVIAYLTAVKLQSLQSEVFPIDVLSVILIDSPLYLDKNRSKATRNDPESITTDNEASDLALQRSRSHFSKCTFILDSYYREVSMLPIKLLSVPIIEFLPSSNISGTFSTSSLMTIFPYKKYSVDHDIYCTPGNHWTMIFGENVKFITDILDSKAQIYYQEASINA